MLKRAMSTLVTRMLSGLGSGLVWVVCSISASAADSVPSPIGGNSMMAGSPFTDYTAGVVAYVLMTGFLVATLLIGGFLILNLGLLSKRKEDRIGGRTPSDVGILKSTVWPEEPDESPTLPAEEDEDRKPRREVA